MNEISRTVDYQSKVAKREELVTMALNGEKYNQRTNFTVDYVRDGLVLGGYRATAHENLLSVWVGDGFKVSKKRDEALPLIVSPATFSLLGSVGFAVWLLVSFNGLTGGIAALIGLTAVIAILVATASIVVLCGGTKVEGNRWSRTPKELPSPPTDALPITSLAYNKLSVLLKTHNDSPQFSALVKAKLELSITNHAEFSAWVLMVSETFEIMSSFPVDSVLLSNENMCEALDALVGQKAAFDRLEAEAVQYGEETLSLLNEQADSSEKEVTLTFINNLSPEMLK